MCCRDISAKIFYKRSNALLFLGSLVATALTASVPLSSSSSVLGLAESVRALNATRGVNATLVRYVGVLVFGGRVKLMASDSNRNLPEDPLNVDVPNTNLLVIFSNYQNVLPKAAVEAAIAAAQQDTIYNAPSVTMPKRMKRYTEPGLERVNLKVTPATITWGEWASVINMLKAFMTVYDNVVLDFVVEDRNLPGRSVARGYFQDNRDDSSDSDGDGVSTS